MRATLARTVSLESLTVYTDRPACVRTQPSTVCSNAAHRARTPSGFARAFFLANP